MKINLVKLQSNLIELSIIFLALESFGFVVGEFVFNPSLMLIIIFLAVSLFKSGIRKKTFTIISLFLLYLFIISLANNDDLSFLLSFLLFGINFSFLLFDSSKFKLNLFKSIKLSLIISFVIVFLDILIPDFNTYFSNFQYPRRISQNIFALIPIDRFSSGFSESSNFGIYLFIMYLIYNYQHIKSKKFEIIFFIYVLISQSFTAYFLFIIYYIFYKLKFNLKSTYYIIIPLLALLIYISYDRLYYIVTSFYDLSYYTSFGRRILSIYLIFTDFLDTNSIIFGLGFENYQIQLIEKFKVWNFDLTLGWVHNTLVNLLLIGGIISIFFLLAIVQSISIGNKKYFYLNIFLLIIISLVSGRLSYWFYWLPLFLTPYFIKNENKIFK